MCVCVCVCVCMAVPAGILQDQYPSTTVAVLISISTISSLLALLLLLLVLLLYCHHRQAKLTAQLPKNHNDGKETSNENVTSHEYYIENRPSANAADNNGDASYYYILSQGLTLRDQTHPDTCTAQGDNAYQSLQNATQDYTSIYTSLQSEGKSSASFVEVDGSTYARIDKQSREEHTYATIQQNKQASN